MSNHSTGDPVGQFTFQGTAERLFGRAKGFVFLEGKTTDEWHPYGGAIAEDTLPSGYEYTTGENWYWLHNLRAVGIEEKQSIVIITIDAMPEAKPITVDPTSFLQTESGTQIGTAHVPRQPHILAGAITLLVDDAGENAVNVSATCVGGFEAALAEIVGYILKGQETDESGRDGTLLERVTTIATQPATVKDRLREILKLLEKEGVKMNDQQLAGLLGSTSKTMQRYRSDFNIDSEIEY